MEHPRHLVGERLAAALFGIAAFSMNPASQYEGQPYPDSPYSMEASNSSVRCTAGRAIILW